MVCLDSSNLLFKVLLIESCLFFSAKRDSFSRAQRSLSSLKKAICSLSLLISAFALSNELDLFSKPTILFFWPVNSSFWLSINWFNASFSPLRLSRSANASSYCNSNSSLSWIVSSSSVLTSWFSVVNSCLLLNR